MSRRGEASRPGGEGQADEFAGGAGLAEAGVYAGEREALQHGLVILAMGRSCWTVPSERGWRLLVEPDALDHALYQLSCYDRESHGWPPPPVPPPPVRGRMDFVPSLLLAATLAGCHWAQLRLGPALADLGCMDGRGFWERRELWRPLTALFLHADLAHLAANGISGLFIFASLTTAFSRGRAWLLLLGCSLVANVATSLLYWGTEYRSLGASTAVFAALGLLTGAALREARRPGGRLAWRRMVTPLASGLGLLGLFGSGGCQTDLAAHLCGFLAGLAGGFLVRPVPVARP
jgi:membrane associated rhomboid family serine protease